MKFRILIICCFLFSSCFLLFPGGVSFNRANYRYDYYAFNKKLDYSGASYLLNPTNCSGSKFDNGSNLATVVNLFEDKLMKNVVLKKNFKDKNGKLVLPFQIHYDISDENIRFLKKKIPILIILF